MNISGLIRNFIGDTHAAEPKTLELKVGEVVKGLVLQLIAEQDALINIGGVHVRAKLETPLKQGQITLLQVQPETTASGQIVLKPLDASGVQIADDSLSEVLKNVGLQDSTSNRQMIQTLHQSGVPISKDNVQAFTQLQSQIPASLPQEEWIQSAAVAFQKGIPLTPDTVSSVRQAISGPAFHETLQQLDSQMNKLLDENILLSGATRSALDTAKQVVAMVRDASNQLVSQTDLAVEVSDASDGQIAKGPNGTAGIGPAANGTGAAQRGADNLAGVGNLNNPMTVNPPLQTGMDQSKAAPGGSVLQSGSAGNGAAAAGSTGVTSIPAANAESPDAAGSRPGAGASPQPGQALGMAAGGSDGQVVVPDRGAAQRQAAAGYEPAVSRASGSSDADGAVATEHAASPNGSNAARGASAAAAQGAGSLQDANVNDHWLSRMMKAIGMEHEHHIGKLPDRTGQDGSITNEVGSLNDQDSQTASSQEQQKTAETLKSALLQLMQADDVPPAFKEAAQQAVQQITGQQLLLNADRTSMFSHITLFVPLMNANGEQTAAIHIQSRKGARGEIDAQNCRLVFDLRMKSLGDTMVDVQVVDRIVSLRVLNDQPFIQQLLDSNREEIAAGLSGIGYQFISLKCGPYPERGQDSQGAPSEPAGKQDNSVASHLQAAYGKKPYRGMDVRV